MGTNLPSVDLGPGLRAIGVRAGNGSVCANLEGGQVKCWGGNDQGQLGLGDNLVRGTQPGALGANLPAVDLGVGLSVVELSAGNDRACARFTAGQVKCWGNPAAGALGLGDLLARGDQVGEMGASLPFLDFGAASTVVELASGASHACVRLNTGRVKCWGFNGNGQLGLGDVQDRGDQPGEMGNALPTLLLE